MVKGVDDTTLEQFVSEAAQRVAEQWAQRTSRPLSPDEMQVLVSNIWESFCAQEVQSAEVQSCP